MSGKQRKGVVDQERLKTAAMLEAMSRFRSFRRWDRVYYIAVLLWALLAALPSVYVGRPLP